MGVFLLAGCAHSPLKAPCGAVSLAAGAAGDCDPKPFDPPPVGNLGLFPGH